MNASAFRHPSTLPLLSALWARCRTIHQDQHGCKKQLQPPLLLRTRETNSGIDDSFSQQLLLGLLCPFTTTPNRCILVEFLAAEIHLSRRRGDRAADLLKSRHVGLLDGAKANLGARDEGFGMNWPLGRFDFERHALHDVANDVEDGTAAVLVGSTNMPMWFGSPWYSTVYTLCGMLVMLTIWS